jgi:hypothetical protein
VVFFPLFSHAVTVGPAKIEQTIDPGTTLNGELFLKNEENAQKTFYPTFEKFTEQNGIKQFVKDESLLASWITTEPSVTLEPGQDRRIPYTINIPTDAPPGGHFAVIWWSTTPPGATSTQQVAIQTRAGILVYINITGDLREAAVLKSFTTEKNKKIFSSAKIPLEYTIANEGNSYIKPQGNIIIKSIFGTEKGTIAINDKGLQILPQSYRTFSGKVWEGSGLYIGPYKAQAVITYGGLNDKQITQEIWFWIMPWKTITIAIVVIILGALGIRKYNMWLINKARASLKEE